MPLYEYESTEDGEVITLLRSMAEADAPVEDPSGLDRTFRRRHSVFGVGSAGNEAPADPPTSWPSQGGCGCGKGAHQCGHRG